MEWQTALAFITSKLKSKCIREKKVNCEDEIMLHLWNDKSIKEFVHIWLKNHYARRECKSVVKAQTFKTMGNKEFKEKNYDKSIQSYTKCALYAPENSNELSVAIANRSASSFYLNRYNDCIKDIELAIKLKYPKQLHYKLYLRAAQCYLKLGKQHLAEEALLKIQEIIHNVDYVTPSMKDNIEKRISEITATNSCTQNVVQSTSELLKLKSQIMFEENTNFPYASAAIDKKYNKKLGWHVVAKKYIKKGDILFLEKPVSFVLLNHDTLHNLCHYCNCSVINIPIPCTTCLNTFYCNENCLTQAWSTYHCWECPGNQMELWKEIGIAHLAIRVLLTCTTTTDQIRFNEMQNLVTNFDKLSMDALILYGITSVMLTTYLLEYTSFFKTNNLEDCFIKKFSNHSFNLNFNTLTDNNKQLYVSSLLLRYILQLISNAHAITNTNDYATDQQNFVATGIYPSASMMNHSCDPNIIYRFVEQYLIVRASRDIAQDEEVFNSYCPNYRRMTTENRQQILKNQYYFTCECKPCVLPKLQYFVERFNAAKCLRCNGALCSIKDTIQCLDCEDKFQIYPQTEIKRTKKIFEAAEVFIDLQKLKEALNELKKCLHIQRVILYKYNEDIVLTLKTMGELYKMMGLWLDSIICFENILEAYIARFGSYSTELLDELNNLIDICMIYLGKELNTSTDTYKNILKKTQKYLNEIEEITSLNYGSWSKLYENVNAKQEKINLYHKIF